MPEKLLLMCIIAGSPKGVPRLILILGVSGAEGKPEPPAPSVLSDGRLGWKANKTKERRVARERGPGTGNSRSQALYQTRTRLLER